MTHSALDHQSHHDKNVTLTTPPSCHDYWAYSEKVQCWVAMTFQEHQAWLARPDLDPVEFASDHVSDVVRVGSDARCRSGPLHTPVALSGS